MLRSVLPVLLFFSALPCLAQTPKLDTSIRRTNWDSLMAHDRKHFKYDSVENKDPSLPHPYFEFLDAKSYDGGIFHSVEYADLNHDRFEDAIAFFWYAGSGRYRSAVSFIGSSVGATYAGYAGGGEHFNFNLSNDTLIVINERGLPGDPNCCYRAVHYDNSIVRHGKLQHVGETIRAYDSTSWISVDQYYQEISNKHYGKAYQMLSQRYQQANPYRKWLRQFETTVELKAEVQVSNNDSVFAVIRTVQEVDGISHPMQQMVVWHPVFRKGPIYVDYDKKWIQDYNWFLDRPEIHEVR